MPRDAWYGGLKCIRQRINVSIERPEFMRDVQGACVVINVAAKSSPEPNMARLLRCREALSRETAKVQSCATKLRTLARAQRRQQHALETSTA